MAGRAGVAASSEDAKTTLEEPAYQLLRYEEDYAYLRDPARRRNALDAIKYVPLSRDPDVYLTLGGDMRERYEYHRHFRWGEGPEDPDGYLLQRYLVHADLHVGPHARVFSQLQSSLESGRTGGSRPTDEDELDLHQAFLELSDLVGGVGLTTPRAPGAAPWIATSDLGP